MQIYRIEQSRKESYIKRETKRILTRAGLMYGSFMVVITVAGYVTLPKLLLFAIGIDVMLVVALLSLYYVMKPQIANRAESFEYVMDYKGVASYFNAEKLSTLNQFAHSEASKKYGIKANRFLTYEQISSTEIKQHEIIIKSRQYNVITKSGAVIFPCEMEQFDFVKRHIINYADKFKLETP